MKPASNHFMRIAAAGQYSVGRRGNVLMSQRCRNLLISAPALRWHGGFTTWLISDFSRRAQLASSGAYFYVTARRSVRK